MGKAEQRAKDQKRAEYMKRHNIYRKTGQCPVCYRLFSVGGMLNHLRGGCK